jgi:catechol 2,3-dioxygenase-like lactoylglutathione lyase family enzyme
MPADPQFLRSAPYFPTASVEASVSHFEDVLGFHVDYAAGSPAEFAIVSRDGLAVMLRRVPSPDRIRPSEAQGGTWDAFFWVRDVDRLHEELSGRGAEVAYGPVLQEAYGMREFAVRTPDGHVLGFGQPVS